MAKKHVKKFVPVDLSSLENQSQTLLANIRFASVDEPVKTVVLTSGGMDEGKSTTALALATAMAKSGKRTLLVDCDMRRRSLGHLLEVHPQFGIYSVLSGTPLKQAVVGTKTPDLYFLDCEPNIKNPPDLLSTKRFRALMNYLRDKFDYVVIDTPPMGMFVDAAILGSIADGTLMVVRLHHAKKSVVADALSQLQTANARVLGLVTTFAQKGDRDYYHYYYYYNEEGQRTGRKKGHKGGLDLPEEPAPMSKREFDVGDVNRWAERVGVATEEPAPQAGRGSHAKAAGKPAADPYKPGAFKNQ